MNAQLKFVILFLSIGNLAIAQPAVYMDYDWNETPVRQELKPEFSNYPAVFILHNKIVELRISDKPNTYITEHRIIHINTNAGIEQYNKVYVPLRGNGEMIQLKVRSVSPDGTVTTLQRENLKELKNVEHYGNFKIFAIEGVTVGGEIEYFYTTRLNPQMYGREVLQRDVPVVEANVEIIYPEKFTFSAKSYNGLSLPQKESFDTKRRLISIHAQNIPALLEEAYSAYEANKMRVDYKLESNGVTTNMVGWTALSRRLLENIYESAATVKVKKFLKPLNIENLPDLEKVRAVEKYIKGNFTVKESGNDAYEDTKEVLENHVGSEYGIIKLYMSCWQALGLSPAVVFGIDRFRGNIDKTYGCPSDIQEVMFYFPTLDQYVTPGVSYLRFGAAPDNLAGSVGGYIDYVFDGNKIEFSEINFKTISSLDYTHNDVGVKASIKFNTNHDFLPEIEQEHF